MKNDAEINNIIVIIINNSIVKFWYLQYEWSPCSLHVTFSMYDNL